MLMQVPVVDPERKNLIPHFEKKLAYFRRIAPYRREEQADDEGEATCRLMLAELRAPKSNQEDAASDVM
ncbi:hypothetical protein [Devosia aurantiaca]|uniref:Uncharacterized protein n=1 Tax=Devosia aurantiaca TaxID=2714858 RepID=A0A6M1SM53_9HYPH|nr:hypothetical protein [Devosia aurantiaca]NGP16622.1 hypothetical protein [Devosia aurantiaca]